MSNRGGDSSVVTKDVVVEANQAKEEAKYESQSTTIITAEDIAKKQAKSVEDIIFNETGVTRTVDAMGRVGVSIRGAEPRHTLILVDGQPVMGDISKYQGAGDELQRLGTENVERIAIVKGAASAKYGSDAIGGVINVVTRRAQKDAGLQVNVEGRRAKGDGDLFPYQNFFLRADSGDIGKFRAAVYGGKREIMPTYSTEERFTGTGEKFNNSLRYYGDIKNIGVVATYDINERNRIDVNIDRTKEDLERYLKRSDASEAPRTQYKRDLTRNKESVTYTGNNGGSTDWKVNYSYSKMTEDDITLSSNYGNSKYEGKNTLSYVDDVVHKQRNISASANTQINDKHLLSYGFGYAKEEASGSRLKSAPNTWLTEIDPWDYDKNLYTEGGTGAPSTNIHAYPIVYNEDGVPQYDDAYDLYGIKDADGNTLKPAYDYEMFRQDYKNGTLTVAPEHQAAYDTFQQQLILDNAIDPDDTWMQDYAVKGYYNFGLSGSTYFQWAGGGATSESKAFYQRYRENNNKVYQGQASLNKYNFFLQDTWQLNDRTILSPILRFDHSSLFGSEVTFNLGLTHNINGNAHHRFKANIGTGYTEPGLGELYYNWEMYGGALTGDNEGRLGYYWIGNPDLKPEKSVNFDMGLETENGKTSTRLNVFHNKIDDYMTTYFTGYLMDYYPNADPSMRFFFDLPDMIYSFKNIGRAEITGVEAEVNHQFNNHWSGRLGYTYLHAINKSDPTMPRQLLDKPQHKADIGVTYENAGWRASLWGNYYIHMLDSNSIANNGNTMYYDSNTDSIVYNFAEGGKQTYEKKTFGVWNFLLQKELSKDSSMYVGVDNIFNHRDDDRALMERVYKIGLNMKFGSDGSVKTDVPTVEKAKEMSREKIRGDEASDWFIKAPFDTTKEQGVEVIGDYRARWNDFAGKYKSEARVTTTSSVGTAEKNVLEKADHGFEQRLRLGVDARIGDNMNVTVLGSASGMSGVDTMYDKSDSKGLNHQRVENIDVTQHVNKWDFSVGRLTEPMGVTGYWFGKEYDGGRAVWTSSKDQVRLGYGDFSHSTGISDSAYTHATRQTFYRAPTKDEWLGVNDYAYEEVVTEGYESLAQKLQQAKTWENSKKLLQEYLQTIKEKDPDGYEKLMNQAYYSYTMLIDMPAIYKITLTIGSGDEQQVVGEYLWASNSNTSSIRTDGEGLTALLDTDKVTAAYQSGLDSIMSRENFGIGRVNVTLEDGSTASAVVRQTFLQFGEYTGTEAPDATYNILYTNYNFYSYTPENISKLTKIENEDALDYLLNTPTVPVATHASESTTKANAAAKLFLCQMAEWAPEDNSSMPLTFFADGSAGLVRVDGTVLVQDQIPSIDRAAFVQYKHQMGDHFGVQAWYLRSVNDDTHSLAYAHGDSNDIYSYDRLANVIGLGAAWRVGDNLRFSFDWGQNRTDFGRMMNGNTIYSHESGTSDFDIEGRSKGGTPRFWVARVDVGHADMDKPGSWNAFADYKYFQHGSFFGGNGTEALPDRYLDGIKSFTIGGGYVPAKDFLIEAFYTFDAKGIGKRDTLYGGENFTLGDYTRIQATFRF